MSNQTLPTPTSQLISLKNKKTIITGAASGIGKATTLRLGEAGAHLILIDKNEEGLKELGNELKNLNFSFELHLLDLANKKEIDEFWKQIKDDSIDVLVNNAGFYPFDDFVKMDEAKYRKILDVNLNSVYWMCHHMIKKHIHRGGKIVNFGSIEAFLPFKSDLTHYALSKAGVLALTRSLAKEYGRKGFSINALLPGAIITGGVKQVAKEFLKFKFGLILDWFKFRSRLPMKRFGEPDEVAKMVLVLSCDLSSYVNGALIPVDGGFLST
jgi:NAD(P)-dependent dehydrogenase (short-subunit alcohol dehydrogenase family)